MSLSWKFEVVITEEEKYPNHDQDDCSDPEDISYSVRTNEKRRPLENRFDKHTEESLRYNKEFLKIYQKTGWWHRCGMFHEFRIKNVKKVRLPKEKPKDFIRDVSFFIPPDQIFEKKWLREGDFIALMTDNKEVKKLELLDEYTREDRLSRTYRIYYSSLLHSESINRRHRGLVGKLNILNLTIR